VEEHDLPQAVREATGQARCPLGDAALRCADAVLAAETCEELFTPASPHIGLALSGVELVGNGSGSHHQARPRLGRERGCCRGAHARGERPARAPGDARARAGGARPVARLEGRSRAPSAAGPARLTRHALYAPPPPTPP